MSAPITSPAPVPAPRQMSKAALRESALVCKRANTPACFTYDDHVELMRLQDYGATKDIGPTADFAPVESPDITKIP